MAVGPLGPTSICRVKGGSSSVIEKVIDAGLCLIRPRVGRINLVSADLKTRSPVST